MSTAPPDPPRPRRRLVWPVTALAAAIVAVGGFAGAKALSGGTSKTSAAPSRPAAPGRRNRPGTVGTLQSVDGTTLTVASFNGNTTTVLTSSATKFFKNAPGALGDVKVGDRVVAFGTAGGDNTVAAQRLSDMGSSPASSDGRGAGVAGRRGGSPDAPSGNGPGNGAPPGRGTLPDPNSFARGTVKSISGTTLTVSQNDGTTKTVTTSPSTTVTVLRPVTLQDLTTGDQVVVTGKTNPDGTVSANVVREGAAGMGPRFGRNGAGGPDGFGGPRSGG